MHRIAQWVMSGDWRPTFEGVAILLTAVVALIAALFAYRGVKKQLDAEKAARNEDLRRQRFGTAAVLRSEIISIWEQDLNPLSAALAKVPKETGTLMLCNGIPLPRAPVRYFPVFERCVGNVGLLSRETISLAVQFYKRLGELLLAWDEYNRCADSDLERFKRLYEMWKGLEHGYAGLLENLSGELPEDSGIQND